MEKSQLRLNLGLVWVWLGYAYFFSGQADKALQFAEKGLKMHTELNVPYFLGSIHMTLSDIHLGLRNLEKALGHGIKRQTEIEKQNRAVKRKSIVAAEKIFKGDLFTSNNITTKRPSGGISPMLWNDVIGRRAKRDFAIDEIISL